MQTAVDKRLEPKENPQHRRRMDDILEDTKSFVATTGSNLRGLCETLKQEGEALLREISK